MSSETIDILYQDDRYVAVDKPAGLLVHRSKMDKYETRFCVQLLRDQLGKHVFPCHRLDKPTSGVLLFALDKEALVAANELFVQHRISKTYHAIVRGWIDEAGTVDHHLKDITDSGEKSGGGSAVTKFLRLRKFEIEVPLGRYPTTRYSFVELVPETGRMHQLRRHMKHLNHHIIGDTNYGDGLHNRFFREHFNSSRLLLNASRLEFVHPFTDARTIVEGGQTLDFDIKLPIVD